MRIRFLSVALTEVNDAVSYYEELEQGLGTRFYVEVRACIENIRNHPKAWARISSRTRRCRTKTFPYGIIYQIRRDEILVVAVASLRRRPEYWKDRI